MKYMEENFGERAINGDMQQADILKAKIMELEEKLAKQQAKGDSTADSQKELNSEDETDEDVSSNQSAWQFEWSMSLGIGRRRLHGWPTWEACQQAPRPTSISLRRSFRRMEQERRIPTKSHC